MRILSMDPGKKNFAYAVLEGRKIVETGFLLPVASLLWGDFYSEVGKFRAHYEKELQRIKPDCVIAERFMRRPGGNQAMGAVGEFINIMLGVIAAVNSDYGVSMHLVTAAQWKTYIGRRYGKLDDRGMRRLLPHLTDHEADAVAIAVYTAEKADPEEQGKLLNYVKRFKAYPNHNRNKKKAKKKTKKNK